jgi:ribosomal protein S12 methylthiotransferase accessory factor
MIKNSFKNFNQGMQKVCAPDDTFRAALKKLRNMKIPILDKYYRMSQPAGIPQYRFIGTEYYKQIVGTSGANGKGPSDSQALASGIMELIERYSCFKYIYNYKDVPIKLCLFDDLDDNLFTLKNIYSNLIDITSLKILTEKELRRTRMVWYPFSTLLGKKVWLPLSLLLHFSKGTTGMAAGNSLEEALVQAICEIIERHCGSLIKKKRLKTPLIDIATIDHPVIKRLLEKFHALKQQFFIKDFSLNLGMPVIGVVRRITKTHGHITIGVATTREEALIRALTENSQTEVIRNRAKIPQHYLSNEKVISFEGVANIGNINLKQELEILEGIIKKNGMKLFFCETTDAELKTPSVIAHITEAKDSSNYEKDWRTELMSIIFMYILKNEYTLALKYINEALRTDKNNKQIYSFYKGYLSVLKEKYRQAAVYLKSYIKNDTIDKYESKRTSFAMLGFCYQALGNVDRAINCYIESMRLNPEGLIPNFPSKNTKLHEGANVLYKKVLRAYLYTKKKPT